MRRLFAMKSVGKGTGLGLSQVYGFVKQSGGHIKIYSKVGQGTTVKVYLPRFLGADEAAFASLPTGETIPSGRAEELVLVVEDEERMRRVAVETFRDLGYSVLHAGNAAKALDLIEPTPISFCYSPTS
jgi:hypothetical protein